MDILRLTPATRFRARCAAIVFGVLLPVAALAAPSLVQPLPQLHGKAKSAVGASDAYPVRFNAAQMHALALGEDAEFALPNGRRWMVTFERLERHDAQTTSWVGYLRDAGKDYRVIATTGPGGTFGAIQTPEGEFRIVPGEGHEWLLDMVAEEPFIPVLPKVNDALVPPRKALLPAMPNNETALTATVRQAADKALRPKAGEVIDLMIVYTTGLAQKLGANVNTRLQFMVTRANQAYIDSGLSFSLRLVHTVRKDYSDTVGSCGATPLNDITDGNGVFSDIATLRNAVGADMVALVRSGMDFSGCGIAWIGGAGQGGVAGVAADSDAMYSVTTGCTAGCEIVFIHELGHNMGNMHDRLTVIDQAPLHLIQYGAFEYSFGHQACTNLACDGLLGNLLYCANPRCSPAGSADFGTVMSYFTPTFYKFSNPALTCNTAADVPPGSGLPWPRVPAPCGVAPGLLVLNSAHDVLSMSQTVSAISAMKPTVVGALPGSVQFSAVSYSVAEYGEKIMLAVKRLNGSSGALSVTYASADGTATAGSDYTAVSGTLNWAAGDTADKFITVPIANDTATEGTETFTVTLSGISGTGAYYGYPTTAIVSILEPWPQGNVFPAGWVTSPGAATGWVLATDFAYENTYSLRSAPLGDATNGATIRADVQLTASTAAGVLSFARKVNSETGFDFFRFYIDSVEQMAVSGNLDWSVVSFTVPTAGVHTFRWSYQKDDAAAPTGDGAWIDAVTLPRSIAVRGDANGDAKGDLFWRDASGGLSWWLMNGAAIAQSNYYVVGTEWQIRDVGDLDGDGRVDLVWRRTTDGANYLWRLDGTSIVGYADLGILGLEWSLIGTADLNGDGKADILWRRSDGLVYAWIMNGGTITSQAALGSIGNEWQIAELADFNGDGKADILWRRTTDGTVYLWTMNGTAIASQATVGTVDPGAWSIVGSGDFNGDGKADILWRNADGSLYQWFMNGSAIVSQVSPGNPGAAYGVASIADFNGDAKADILLRHSNGTMLMWFMNGSTVTTTAAVANPGGTWQIAAP